MLDLASANDGVGRRRFHIGKVETTRDEAVRREFAEERDRAAVAAPRTLSSGIDEGSGHLEAAKTTPQLRRSVEERSCY